MRLSSHQLLLPLSRPDSLMNMLKSSFREDFHGNTLIQRVFTRQKESNTDIGQKMSLAYHQLSSGIESVCYSTSFYDYWREKNMHKMKVVCLVTLLIMLSFCCNPVGTQFGYEEQICPLSRHTIETAEDLMEMVQENLTEANKEGIYTTEVEITVSQGYEFLQKAKMFYQKGHSCITANNFAFKSINVFKESIEMLESRLQVTKDEEYAVYKA
jgi:hypothetical protein